LEGWSLSPNRLGDQPLLPKGDNLTSPSIAVACHHIFDDHLCVELHLCILYSANMPGSESHGPLRKPRSIPDNGFMATAYRLWQVGRLLVLRAIYMLTLLKKTYAADYLGLIILTVFFLLIEVFIEPFHKLFSLRDLRISFPHAEIERVPVRKTSSGRLAVLNTKY